MGINSRTALDPRLQLAVSRPLALFQICTISIIDVNTDTAWKDFNPVTMTGTSTVTTLWTGKAQLSVSRQTLNSSEALAAITQLRSVTFELPAYNGPDFVVLKGMQIRIVDAPTSNPTILNYQYTVTSGLNQDNPFARTIEAEADLSVQLPAES